MHLHILILLLVAVLSASPAAGQAIDADLEAPVPPPRPEALGGEALPDGEEVDEIEPEIRPDFSHITAPQPVTFSARLTDDGPFIPNGLVWRVFDTRTDESGELAMVAKSEEATAAISLPPGEYILHVAYGRAQASDTVFVEPGPNTHTIVFEVGGLRLDALITGDVPIPDDMLRFDILADGPGGRATVAENVSRGELVHLNAGIYSIVSRFGPINAVIRSELRVEPGQITEATLYHRAAQVALRLVSEAGGEAIADVEWTVQTQDGETIFTDIGAFPATVLAEGDYLVLAKLGENVYNREFSVAPGSPREVEILTAVY